jgi:cytolysin-activating lysine-acyltransferase
MNEMPNHDQIASSNTFQISRPEAVGYMVGLCVFKNIYSHWSIASVGRLFIPPVLAGQFKLYFRNGECVGFVTWACLSDELSDAIRSEYIDPPYDAWNSGENIWIIDIVAPGLAPQIARDLQKNVFAGKTSPGFALRRDETGKVRKIARWATWNSCPRDAERV